MHFFSPYIMKLSLECNPFFIMKDFITSFSQIVSVHHVAAEFGRVFYPPYYRDLSMNRDWNFLKGWWDAPYSEKSFVLEVIFLDTATNT